MDSFLELNKRFTNGFNKKLLDVCNPFLQTFGLKSFFYHSIKGTHFATICTDVELQNYYFDDKKMYRNNPFIMFPSHLKSGLYFDALVDNSKFQTTEKKLENEFGVKYICRRVKRSSNKCKEFGFGRSTEKSETDTLLINNSALIDRFIDYFEKEMGDVLQDMDKHAIDLASEMKIYVMDNSKTGLPTIEYKTPGYALLLKQLGCKPYLLKVKFTKREQDCIKLILKGYSSKNIAEILSLSHRTVEHNIERLKDKLLCESKFKFLEALHLMHALNLINS